LLIRPDTRNARFNSVSFETTARIFVSLELDGHRHML
jgi:hypothetical protein